MSDIKIKRRAPLNLSARPAEVKIKPGGNPSLFNIVYEVTVCVKNTGSVNGAAVPQLYLS